MTLGKTSDGGKDHTFHPGGSGPILNVGFSQRREQKFGVKRQQLFVAAKTLVQLRVDSLQCEKLTAQGTPPATGEDIKPAPPVVVPRPNPFLNAPQPQQGQQRLRLAVAGGHGLGHPNRGMSFTQSRLRIQG